METATREEHKSSTRLTVIVFNPTLKLFLFTVQSGTNNHRKYLCFNHGHFFFFFFFLSIPTLEFSFMLQQHVNNDRTVQCVSERWRVSRHVCSRLRFKGEYNHVRQNEPWKLTDGNVTLILNMLSLFFFINLRKCALRRKLELAALCCLSSPEITNELFLKVASTFPQPPYLFRSLI